MKLYILEGKEIKITYNQIEWHKAMEYNNRIVEQTIIDGIRISTVFLGVDHSFLNGPPLLFETMVFGGEHDEYQIRYSTWDEAYEGHHKTCAMILEV